MKERDEVVGMQQRMQGAEEEMPSETSKKDD